MNFRLRNAYVQGLQQFEIDDFDLRIFDLKVHFEVFFKQLVIDGQHSTRASLGVLAVSGDGPVTMVFNDFKINGTISLHAIRGGYLNIDEFALSLNVGTANANLRGFGTILDATISTIMSAAMPSLINESSDRVNDAVTNTIVPALNELLYQYRLHALIFNVISRIIGRNDLILDNEN